MDIELHYILAALAATLGLLFWMFRSSTSATPKPANLQVPPPPKEPEVTQKTAVPKVPRSSRVAAAKASGGKVAAMQQAKIRAERERLKGG